MTIDSAADGEFLDIVYATVFDATGVTLIRDETPLRSTPWVLSLETDYEPLAADIAAAVALVPPGERVEVLPWDGDYLLRAFTPVE